MSGARRQMQDVELVDTVAVGRTDGRADGGADGGASSGAGAAADAPGRSFGRRHRWWILGGALALALLLVVPRALEARSERARVDRLVGVPGVLGQVDGPLAELWSSDQHPGDYGSLSLNLDLVDDTLVTTSWSSDGNAARGLDPRTGASRWVVPISADADGGGQCVIPDPADATAQAVVVCVVVDATETRTSDPNSGEAISTYTATTAAHLVVLDAATGEQLAERPAAPQTVLSTLGGDVVLSSVTDGAARVSRVDPLSGDARWEYRRTVRESSEVADGLVVPTTCYAPPGPGDTVLVTCGETSWELSADGTLVRDLPTSRFGSVETTASGRLLSFAYDPVGSTFEVTDLGSGATVAPGGSSSLMNGLDDGSVPNLLVSTGGALDAWDLDTGDKLWSDESPATSAVVVDGTIYTATSGVARARDARTGAGRWRAELPDTGSAWLATDGRVLVVAANHGSAEGGSLTAFDLDDGHQEWTTALDRGVGMLFVASGRLFAMGTDGVVVAFG